MRVGARSVTSSRPGAHVHAAQLGLRLAQHERRDDVGRRACLRTGPRRPAPRSASRRRVVGRARARRRSLFTPSATIFMSATMSSSFRPCPSSTPTVRFRLCVARARGDEVAHAGEAGERERVAAERDAEPRELGEPAGDERGLRVVAVAEAVGDPGGDRDHVLERAGDLTADDVGVRVHAERHAS